MDEEKSDTDDDPDSEEAPTAKKMRTAGVLSTATLAAMCMNPKTISSWKKTYPWMTWDGTMDNGMKCIECAAAGKTDGAFTDEDGCCVFMVKNCQQHHKTHHVAKATAADAKQATVAARSSLGAAAAETGSSAAKTVHAQRLAYMEVAYTTSKQVTSSDHQLKANLDAFDRGAMRLGLSSGATTEYCHHHGAANATMAFSGWLSAKQLERILASPLIGIACDESTDVAVTERMVVYIYYICEGNVQGEYFEMVELQGASAEQTKTALLGSLKNCSALLLLKLTIFDSDGFSVMFGIDGGVGTLLRGSADECGGEKALVEYLLQLHCFAQKLQLSVAEGLDTPEMRVINRLLSGSYGAFSHSGKRRAGS